MHVIYTAGRLHFLGCDLVDYEDFPPDFTTGSPPLSGGGT